jgi:hypothetical protein
MWSALKSNGIALWPRWENSAQNRVRVEAKESRNAFTF